MSGVVWLEEASVKETAQVGRNLQCWVPPLARSQELALYSLSPGIALAWAPHLALNEVVSLGREGDIPCLCKEGTLLRNRGTIRM